MTAQTFLLEFARTRRVSIAATKKRLRVRGPLSPDDRAVLRHHRDALIAALTRDEDPTLEPLRAPCKEIGALWIPELRAWTHPHGDAKLERILVGLDPIEPPPEMLDGLQEVKAIEVAPGTYQWSEPVHSAVGFVPTFNGRRLERER